MNIRAIDYITEDFYESLSFQDGELPDLETVKGLFYGDGLLINNSFSKPITFTAENYTQNIETEIADGTLKQFMQRELHSKTEAFAKVAYRISVYEYTLLSDQVSGKHPKGVNYIQFVLINDTWKIASMTWCDENENHQIPEEFLG